MAYSATYGVDIQAPPSRVFDYLADVSRHGEWGSEADHMKATAVKPGPPTVGSRYEADGMLNGRTNHSVVTITALEAPKRIAFDAEDSNSVFHHEFVLTQAGAGTHVQRNVTMTKGPFFFPIVLAIFKGTVQKNYDGAMSNLKAKMEV